MLILLYNKQITLLPFRNRLCMNGSTGQLLVWGVWCHHAAGPGNMAAWLRVGGAITQGILQPPSRVPGQATQASSMLHSSLIPVLHRDRTNNGGAVRKRKFPFLQKKQRSPCTMMMSYPAACKHGLVPVGKMWRVSPLILRGPVCKPQASTEQNA